MNVYLWDEAAESFRLKFDASAATPTVYWSQRSILRGSVVISHTQYKNSSSLTLS